MNLTLGELAYFRSYDGSANDSSFGPRLAAVLERLQAAVNNIGVQTNAMAVGSTPAPPPISGFTVSQADGIFDFQIFDANPVNRGIEYFIEYSTTAAFEKPVVIDVGSVRNYRANLGNQTLYFRAYSAYATSPASPPLYWGSATAPTAVVGAGGVAGPAPLPSTGSGTASSYGTGGGAGYGRQPSRIAGFPE